MTSRTKTQAEAKLDAAHDERKRAIEALVTMLVENVTENARTGEHDCVCIFTHPLIGDFVAAEINYYGAANMYAERKGR